MIVATELAVAGVSPVSPNTLPPCAPWPSALSALPPGHSLHCWRSADPFSHLTPLERGAALGAMAASILSQAEYTAWRALAGPLRRRRDWLLGRAVAKVAAQSCLQADSDVAVPPSEIAIVSDRYGRPSVDIPRRTTSHVPAISIAHTSDMAVALAVNPSEGRRPGIDVEPAGRTGEGIFRVAFTDAERELVSALVDSAAPEWPLRLWCAKEALAKALGRGLLGGPRSIVVRSLDVRRGSVELSLAGPLACAFPSLADAALPAFTICDGDLIAAVAMS